MDGKILETLRAVGGSAAGGELAPLVAAAADVLTAGIDLRAVVLVEGASDRLALEATAERRGQDLHAEGVAIVPMGGATNIRRFLALFGPRGLDVRLAGLCDDREVGDFRRGLERAGLGANLSRSGWWHSGSSSASPTWRPS